MSAHVLLNLIHELGNRDKMQDLLCILSLFRNEFNKFNKTGARMLGSKMTLKFHLGVKKILICHYVRSVVVSRKSVNH